jgi:hypothetical protein
MGKDDLYDPKTSYLISQVAHITCKKDNHQILANTVSEELSAGYEKLQSSALVLIRACTDDQADDKPAVKSLFVSRYASNIKIEADNNGSVLTYAMQMESFSTRCVHEEKLPVTSLIILIIPKFDLFVMGDLNFYADVLGIPNSCSYWCPFCLLSRIEWQESAANTGETRTSIFLEKTYEQIKEDKQNKLQPTNKKGVSTAVHYKSLTPLDFVPPLLHMEIGMVNQAWESFQKWMDDYVEKIPVDEKIARDSVAKAKEMVEEKAREKDQTSKNLSIEVRGKNPLVKSMKGELKQGRGNPILQQDIQTSITLMESLVKEQKEVEKKVREAYKEAQNEYSSCKKQIEILKKERDRPESSIMAEVELTLKLFYILLAAYHGGISMESVAKG